MRVTRPGGHILVAYCMNEPTVIQYVFGSDHLREVTERDMLTSDWHCISDPREIFELVRTEDIEELDAAFPVRRIRLVAADGATNYHRELIDAMEVEHRVHDVLHDLWTCYGAVLVDMWSIFSFISTLFSILYLATDK